MINFKKILAFVLAALMLMSLAACSDVPTTLSKQWSYKTDTQEYAAGVYLFSMFSAYDNAYGIISDTLGDDFDDTASIVDIECTFDETDVVYSCRDWVKKEADIITRNLIAMDQEIAKYGIELDGELVESAREQALKDWYLGPYYDLYPDYTTPYKDLLEPFGISFESYFQCSEDLASVKQYALFNYFYGKGGEKEVPVSETKNYFEENYMNYSYFTVDLYESEIDESGNTTNTPLSDEEILELETALSSYADAANSGALDMEGIAQIYMSYAELDTNPTKSYVENKAYSELPAEVLSAYETMSDNTAQIVYVGSEESQIAYFIYKDSVSEIADDYVSDEVNYSQLLSEIKGDEFTDYLYSLSDMAECEANTAFIDKCDPKMFEGV